MWRARFRGKFNTAEELASKFGTDGELFKMFRHWYDLAVDCMKKTGSHNCRITWGSEGEARQIIVRKKRQTSLEEPEDELWNPADYQVHG